MRIDHAAIFVADLEKARDFFLKYFSGTSNNGYHNEKTGFRSYFISFDDGSRLEIMNKPGMADPKRNRTGRDIPILLFLWEVKKRLMN